MLKGTEQPGGEIADFDGGSVVLRLNQVTVRTRSKVNLIQPALQPQSKIRAHVVLTRAPLGYLAERAALVGGGKGGFSTPPPA